MHACVLSENLINKPKACVMMNVYEVMIPIVAIISTFTFLTVAVYLFFSSRHKERMALMDHNLDATIFNLNQNGNRSLKSGLLFTMIGVGLILGDILERLGLLSEDVAYFAMVFLMGGLALVAYHSFVAKKGTPDDI